MTHQGNAENHMHSRAMRDSPSILRVERTLLHASICLFAHALTDFVAECTVGIQLKMYTQSCLSAKGRSSDYTHHCGV